MEKSLNSHIAAIYSPLVLAYMGDSVYELIVRERIVRRGNCPVNRMYRDAVHYVKASAQAKIARKLEEAALLSEEERTVLKRGRNAHSKTMAKHASMVDYRMATGLEALLGYLWLSEEKERVLELVEAGIRLIDEEDVKKHE